MKKTLYSILLVPFALSLQMCSPKVPDSAVPTGRQPKVSPDYADLVVPVNIAPLNFCINEKGDDYVTHFRAPDGAEMIVGGKMTDIDVDAWHELLSHAKGDTLRAYVYVGTGGNWQKYDAVSYVVAEEIDPYISYRHIEPLYVTYEVQKICQRNLENFDIDEIYNNSYYLDNEGDRQCINCHSYQDYNRGGNMQMHVRVVHPGTVIARDGKLSKVNLKVGKAFSNGAYLSWHPSLPLIAYSINDTWQHFHSTNSNKVEVQDAASDLILYDVEGNTVRMVEDSPTELETFPYWSPKGDKLYYISAQIPEMTPQEMAAYRMEHYADIKYNIYKKDFDMASRTFGPVDTVFDAKSIGFSATFPRESPDGRYLLFTMGEYGTFHNFHHDADLYLMDLSDGRVRNLEEANSGDTESYHSWSSNGRWIVFSSRRDNGAYTRLYLTHFDADGRASKPFMVPEKSPFANDMMFRSYNVPEFMVRPVEITKGQWMDAIEKDAVDARFVESSLHGSSGVTASLR